MLDMDVHEVWQSGTYKRLATARSLRSFWAVPERGESMASIGRRLGISTVAVRKSVARGEEIAKINGHLLTLS